MKFLKCYLRNNGNMFRGANGALEERDGDHAYINVESGNIVRVQDIAEKKVMTVHHISHIEGDGTFVTHLFPQNLKEYSLDEILGKKRGKAKPKE